MMQVDALHRLHRDDVIRSVDSMVGHLLTHGNDTLALALYFWVARSYGLVLVNGDDLAAWARAYVKGVFVDRRIGRQRDTEIASAALAAIALQDTDALAGLEGAVCEGISTMTRDEISRHSVPFNSAAYGSILLLAARTFQVTALDLSGCGDAIADLYDHAVLGGRAFGMGFAVDFLHKINENGRVEDVTRRARAALNDPRIGYEDQLYLLQALWVAQPVTGDIDLVDLSERVLERSPGLLYIGHGNEDISPTSRDDMAMPISHLYRAMLLYNLLRVEQVALIRSAELFNERYRGNRAIITAAFAAYLFPIILVWCVVVTPLVAARDAADRFWLQQQFGAMSVVGALLYSLDLAFLTLLVPCTWTVVGDLWSVLVRAHVESDRRLKDVVATHLSHTIMQWKGWFALAFLVNVLSGFAPSGLAHILHTMTAK